jgi:large subunit ribosomal protein L27
MAHTKAQKATKGNRDSFSKRLGLKIYGGQKANAGNIILRQRGTKFFAGENVLCSKDHTLIALKAGLVEFYKKLGKQFVKII